MSPTAIPEELARFIRQHIHSVLQLELLLLLRERGGQWSVGAIASELRITERMAQLRLKDLYARGFVAADAELGAYRYAPESPDFARQVDALAHCYSEARYAVINLIFSEPGDSARSIADAFRLRKGKDE